MATPGAAAAAREMSSSPKNKRPMEADPSSREEQVQAKRGGPRREEAPALLPMPAGSARFVNYSKWINAKAERKRREAELGLTPPVEEAQVPPTLEDFEPPTTFHKKRLLHVRESGTMAVLTAAKSLLGVSSSVGGKPLKRCSGFWIDWDEESKTGTVLTTAHLIRTKEAPTNIWSGGEEYDPHANVTVHLLDGTSAEGQLLYHQPHYDVAFVRVRVDKPVQLPSFNEEVKLVQDVFRLGRDNMLDLRITYGRAVSENPDTCQRYHDMCFHCAGVPNNEEKYDGGGPVIDLEGKVVGMSNVRCTRTFIPSSILLKCLDLWKKYEYKYIPRPHLGMTFEAIKLLEPAHVDKIWRMYNIDNGLVVQKVSKGSHAEKFGIQIGDIIECCNGESVSTTVKLENMLMSICKGSSDNLNGLNVEVNVSVEVFHTLKKLRTVGELAADVSDHGEVIIA
ncbi:serine protease HTRA3 [Brachypodium distachyon]|uniref:PDZ domain-containing protein n=2 Tax=Brachypodium distachyon TaxID=15368 RepID=I1IG12_BRADI|nr:serine protease HTRA3 [Brachypodium distachyon]KQJ85591.1 hypothetical protein BRADI_4g00450v3 [Brachypodium distachyon]KQJ85592.1 hypothetical protein BRADI_4g00450v3 [Brachypodium distachyon]|eukprot:XP_003577896.1 serine protease HTRA3 [Brachypodium distachyon]